MTTDIVAAAPPGAPPTTFCVMVDCPLERAALHLQAMDFCRALISNAHSLLGIFYYGDAVALLDPARAADLRQSWCRLLDETGTPGVVCVAAANRRGLTDHSGTPHAPLPPPLRLGGLGEWASWSIRAQRMVRFG